MHDFDQFERRLADALRSDADASVGPFEAGSIARAAIAETGRHATRLPRASSRPARRFGRGRGITLLAAAALLLVGGAWAVGSGLLRLPTVLPPVPEPSVIAVATASPEATSPSPSESAAPSASPIPVAGPGGVWIPTGSMVTPRSDHTAVRLLDGRVLVVGGNGVTNHDLTSAELYDPATGTWSATGDMLRPPGGFSATLLRDGTVLVGDVDDPGADDEVHGAEVYDPATGTWTATAKMVKRADFVVDPSASLLGDGKVLVAGLKGAQLYDPDSGTWTATGTMVTPRYNHAATLLPDGRVLVVGGDVPPDQPTDSAELYDPNTGTWTATASLSAIGHVHPVAVLLADGTVLVVRGPSAEIYDPATGTWTEIAGPTEFGYRTATLMSDGTMLVAGLYDPNGESETPCTAAALYDPRTGSTTTASSMLRCGDGSSFTPLLDGTVLVAGGSDCNDDGVCVANGAAELYVPAGVSLPPLPAFPNAPPPDFPSPTPRPTPLAPAVGPVPPGARTWTVTVDNKSSEPATLFQAEEGETGVGRLCGNVTPNVVPAGAKVQVTFLLPPKNVTSCWIWVNPVPGEGGSFFQTSDAPLKGGFLIDEGGQEMWGGAP